MRFLETVTLGEAVIFVGGVLVLLGVLRKLWPFLTRAVRTVDALDALPSLVEEMRASVATVATLGGKVDTIHHEVTPNGGGSMKDELRRQSETLARLDRQQLDLQAGQRELEVGGKRRDEEIQGVRNELRGVGDEQSRVRGRLQLQADALRADDPDNLEQP